MAVTYATSISYFSGTDLVKNVVAGQALYITISVKATGGNVPVGTTVTLAKVQGGITVVGTIAPLQVGSDPTVATTVALLQIPDNAVAGTSVSFNLTFTNGVTPPTTDITYTVKAIVQKSLALMLDNALLLKPTVDNPPGTGTTYSTYSTVLSSAANTPLPNVQVAITAVLPASIGDFTFSTNATAPVTLPIVSVDDTRQYFVVISDAQGKVSFRAYPIINKTGVMVLTSTFFGSPVPSQQALSPLIVIDLNKKMNPIDVLSPPSILEIQNGVLTAANNAVACHALIPAYHNSSVGDYIVPIVNDKYTGNLVQITDTKELNTYFMSLPFNLFKVSMDGSLENSFSYAIASTSGNVTRSYSMGFVYKGGAGNKPANIPRPFEIGSVYSSYDNGTGKPEDIIIVNAVINHNDVSQTNTDHAALYFAINGVRNNNNNKNPVFGQKIGVRVYILSVNKSLITDVTDITPGATFGNKYFTMPTAANGVNTARLFVKIPLTIVGGVRADPDTGGPGSIYIEYYTYDANPQVYGAYWQGFINTVNPGQ